MNKKFLFFADQLVNTDKIVKIYKFNDFNCSPSQHYIVCQIENTSNISESFKDNLKRDDRFLSICTQLTSY